MRGPKAVSELVSESEGGHLFRDWEIVPGQGDDPSVETPPSSLVTTDPALPPAGYPGQAQGAPGEVSVGDEVRQAVVTGLQGGEVLQETLQTALLITQVFPLEGAGFFLQYLEYKFLVGCNVMASYIYDVF